MKIIALLTLSIGFLMAMGATIYTAALPASKLPDGTAAGLGVLALVIATGMVIVLEITA